MATEPETSLSARVEDTAGAVLDDLECPICNDLVWKPITCRNCEVSFCSDCIQQWLAENPTVCPNRCLSFAERRCPTFITKQLARLQITCMNQPSGCEQVLGYEALEKHEINCGHKMIQCGACHKIMLKKDLSHHENTCGSIRLTCSECHHEYLRRDAPLHTENNCMKEQLRQIREESARNKRWQNRKMTKLTNELEQSDKKIAELNTALQSLASQLDRVRQATARWVQKGVTVAGRHRRGDRTNQLNCPYRLCVDEEDTVIIAHSGNDRIVEWKRGATSGTVLAGGNGKGKRPDRLNRPTDVIIDKETNSIIICDQGNHRVTRWSRRSEARSGETILDNIDCFGLAMDDEGSLYVTDSVKHEVRRYRRGDSRGIVVAGGNGKGDDLNQLNDPRYVCVDVEHTVYVLDKGNHRVMKWMNDAKEGIVMAGGRRRGEALTQFSYPAAVQVDTAGNIYVIDRGNNRLMRWCCGARQGTVVVGGNEKGETTNQFNFPTGLSFDQQGHLYVADCDNDRVQRFSLEKN